MRYLFLVPALNTGALFGLLKRAAASHIGRRLFPRLNMTTTLVHGGTLNILRHCAVAQSVGVDAYMSTLEGRDCFGEQWGIQTDAPLRFVPWDARRPTDVCLIPDFASHFVDDTPGTCIVYEQNPRQVHADFDYKRDNVIIWTDSPFMLEICERTFPGKEIEIVPNIVDHRAFPFVPQHERRRGELIAFPRKGPDFIRETLASYHARSGSYWHLTEIDGLPFRELARRFSTPQAFLASADVEGCALPPQEAMASGMVVVGKDARGANFCMEDGQTALIANTPEAAAEALLKAEDDALRDRVSRAAHEQISRYFATSEPTRFWRRFSQSLSG